MKFSDNTKNMYQALLDKTDKDVNRIDDFLNKTDGVKEKFKDVEKQEQWRSMTHELKIYHLRYKDARETENNFLMESAMRQQYLDENPDEELTALQEEYEKRQQDFFARVKAGETDEQLGTTQVDLVKFHRKVLIRERQLKDFVNERSLFERRDPAVHAAASSIVNSVIGIADFVTAGHFPELKETMKELAMPDLRVDAEGNIIKESELQEDAIAAAGVLGALLTPLAEAKAAGSLIQGAAKYESLGTRAALAASAGVVNYGSALALTVADDDPEANAGFAGAMAASLGYGGKVGWMLFGGSTGALVGNSMADDPELGVAGGLAVAGTALVAKGAYGKMFPGVGTLLKDAKTIFNMSDDEFIKVQSEAMKLFNVEDVSKLTDEQMLVSIFNANPNAKGMMHKAILTDEVTKSKINGIQGEVGDAVRNMLSKGNIDDAIGNINKAKDDHMALKKELADGVTKDGLNVKVDIQDIVQDFKYAWALTDDEAKLLTGFEAKAEHTAYDMLKLRDVISNNMKIGSNSILDKKIALKSEKVLAKIDNQVLQTFDPEQQALYFLNNNTQAQLRTLMKKGTGLADFTNKRLPMEKRYAALNNVMASEQQYANLLKVFEGEPAMMQSFEDVVLNRMFEKATKENVIDFVKLSGEINKLPWKDVELTVPTYSREVGDVIESRGPAIAEVVDLFKNNYKNTRFMGGFADDMEYVGIRTNPVNMAQATAMTKIYHTVAKLWSGESRLISSLPKYLKNQQIPADVTIEGNEAVFGLMKMLHPEIQSNKLYMAGDSARKFDEAVSTKRDAHGEMNYIMPARDRSMVRGLGTQRGPAQEVNVGGQNPISPTSSPESGWKLIPRSENGQEFTEAMFVLKDKDAILKVTNLDVFENGVNNTMKLSDVIDSKVYRAYPDLADIRVRFTEEPIGSYYDEANNLINIAKEDLTDTSYVYERIASSVNKVKPEELTDDMIAEVRRAYNLPKTLDGRMRLILNHEMQHAITRRHFPKVENQTSLTAEKGLHDEVVDERISDVTRMMHGQSVNKVNLQTAINSQDAMRGSNGVEY